MYIINYNLIYMKICGKSTNYIAYNDPAPPMSSTPSVPTFVGPLCGWAR